MRRVIILCGLALACGAAVPAPAGEIVLFADGRSMRVAAVEPGPEMTRLDLEGGGRLAVPSSRIQEIRRLEEPRPEPAAVRPAGDAWRRAAGEFAGIIEGAASRHDLDPVLLTALAMAESSFDPRAVSPKGAAGLLQLMPDTATRFGVRNVFDASENVEAGARYLRWLLERYAGRTELALAGYNAGEGAVDRHRGIPPYDETREYVTRVLANADRLVGTAR